MSGWSLAGVGAFLLGAQFVAWRVRPRGGALVFGLVWTVWLAEVLLLAQERYERWWYAPPAEDPAELLPRRGGPPLGRDLAAQPAPGRTVVVVGDSFMAGLSLRDDQTATRVLARALGDEVDQVVRLAVPGWNLAEEIVAYVALGAPLAPDVVIWVFVPNDLGGPRPYSESALIRALVPSSTGVRLLDRLRRLRDDPVVEARTTEAYARVLADPERLERLRRSLGPLVEEVTGRGGRFVFALHPLLHRLDEHPFRAEHARLAALARDLGAEVVDLLPLFEGRDAASLWIAPWDHHPNAEAHRLVGEAFARAILAEGVPDAGATHCASLPVDLAGTALVEACEVPDGERLLRLAEVLAGDPGDDPWFGHRHALAAQLAVVAAARLEQTAPDDEHLARADAVIASWRRTAR